MSTRDSHRPKTGLPRIVDSSTRVLVLGSLPSDQSIEAQQYYANPKNHFWRIVYSAFDAGEPAPSYDERLSFLCSVGIGLWDVLSSADRAGSSDSSIRDGVANEIPGLLREYPGIRLVLANGTKARDIYRRQFRGARLSAIYVPSSSPARGRHVLPWERRVPLWRDALGLDDPSNKRIEQSRKR